MADLSRHREPSWIPFFAGALAALALVFGYLAWRAGEGGVSILRAASLPSFHGLEFPRLPEAPRLPDAPMPRPL